MSYDSSIFKVYMTRGEGREGGRNTLNVQCETVLDACYLSKQATCVRISEP